jgi:serine/threonine protein kinase
VNYLHERWIIHRDIKLSNLLYNNKGQLKLADFGLARLFSYPSTTEMTLKVVSLWYRAPELLLGSETYTTAIDVWSIGCVVSELLAHRNLMDGDNELDQLSKIFRLLGSPNSRIWPELGDLKYITNNTINLGVEQDKYPYSDLGRVFPELHNEGIDFINSLLTYDPSKRTNVITIYKLYNIIV